MLSTIQPIGNRPDSIPRPAARTAMPAGIPNASVAHRPATTSAEIAAQWAATRRKASATSITATGSAATNVETTMLPIGS